MTLEAKKPIHLISKVGCPVLLVFLNQLAEFRNDHHCFLSLRKCHCII